MTGPSAHPVDLEPSLVASRTYATRRRPMRIDASLALSAMLILLLLIPERYALPGMSTPGRPALLAAVGLWGWWALAKLHPRLALTGPQPIRWGLAIFVLSIILSYGVGFTRGLTSMEANSADRWILFTVAFCGVALAAADGIANWERLNSVLRALVWCSTIVAVFALAQFIFKTDFVAYLTIPGLESVGSTPELQARGQSIRVASTLTHYIELSAVLAMVLPICIHFARFAADQRARRRYAIAAVVLVGGILVTFSRTGLISIVIGAVFLMPQWSWRLRYNVLVLGFGLLVAAAVAQPRLMATTLAMFTGASQDTSITSRTQRYAMVGYYFEQRPWLGRGTGTWVPPQYQYLDNQWLTTALTNGLVGVAALLTLHLVAIALALMAWRRATSAVDKHLCAALVSIQVIAIFVAATVDSLWYSTYSMVLALFIGLSGTVWRFTHPTRQVRTAAPQGWLRG